MPIPSLNFVIIFVSSPLASGAFYTRLLGLEPVEQSETFVMFALPGGVMLGLWSRGTAKPTVTAAPGASEIAFVEKDVDAVYTRWCQMGIAIAQEPVEMEGGRSFVALDPDGHRIRIIWPHEGN